ncbi:site-2 protease family protein [Natronomonas sp. EA1]|uniref:site-2 protease family protein n=1 Tax=Natronomonas sp. EA1 TaxID=3421655 RepID=UPI003EB6E44F
MVDTLTLVLVGIVAYTLVAMVAKSQGLLPDAVRVSGPITTIHTQRGKAFLTWLAGPKRFWRAWGNFGVGIALVVMVGSFLLVLFAGVQALTNPTPTPLNRPRNVLAIPGVNEFLPLSAAVEILLGLLIGLVVHEGGHGLLCRVEDIDIDSMGVALLAFIPIGAFVQPDEESRKVADRGAQTRMFAAGVTNNFAVAIVAYALLFGPVIGSIGVVAGVPIGGTIPGAPADRAGIERGDVITAVDGVSVENAAELEAVLANTSERSVSVTLKRGETVTVQRSLVVVGATADAPLEVNTTVVAVNGTEVHTQAAFERAIADRPVATLTTATGETVTAPMGAYAVPVEGEAFVAAGAPAGETVFITRIDDTRIDDQQALARFLDTTSEGQQVRVVAYVDGERRTYEVTLGAHPSEDTGFLGVGALQPGTSGMAFDDFGIDEYPASFFLSALGGGEGSLGITSFAQRAFLALTLPFAGVSLGVGHNFPGFVGVFQNFYVAEGALSFLGSGGLFFLASTLFWTAWINLIIGQFNCIPAFPLDGGHILRASTEAVVSRLPVTRQVALTRAVTTTVSLSMLAALLLMVFGPRLLT